MTDSAANRDSTWHPRDYEAQVLVELLRLSRVTVLYGAEGVGKTTLLKTGVLPLLRPRADDRNFAQDEKPRVVVPFPDRHAGDGTVDRGAEIAIVFDQWSNTPLTALQAQILDTLPIESTRMAAPLPSLADSLAAWNEELGVRFFIILDCFEQYLRAPFDRAGIAEFDDEFVRTVNEPLLAANFLLSVRDDAEALMNRFRERISGFGDAYLRLPSLHHVTAPSLAPGAQTHRPAAAATPPVAASETLTARPSEPPKPLFVLDAALTAGPLPARAAFLAGSGEPLRSSTVSEGALSHVQPPEVTASASAEPDAGPEQSRDALLAASSARAVGPPFAPDVPPTASQTPPQEHASQSSGARQPAIDDATINGLEPTQALQGARGIEPSVCALVQPYSSNKRAQFALVPKARGAAPGEAVPAPPTRTELRRPVRSPARISLAAIVAGFAIGAGAGYFAVYGYQRNSTWHTASSAKGVAPATAHTAGLSTVPVPPATRAIHLVPPPSSKRTSAVHRSAPPPRSPTPIKSAKAASPTPKVAARIAPPQVDSVFPEPASVVRAVPIAATVVINRQTAMHRELDVCRQEKIFARVVCTEKVRWKHCAPNRWNTIPECAAGDTQVIRSD